MLRHREEGKALLLREEAQLEQGRGDLLELSRQLEELLRRRDRLEVSKLLGPLASRLDRIGGELRTTGQVVARWKNTTSKTQKNPSGNHPQAAVCSLTSTREPGAQYVPSTPQDSKL